MKIICPYCSLPHKTSDGSFRIVRDGRFRRKSDARFVPRFFCKPCRKYFSRATTDPCRYQKKRQFNRRIFVHLCSVMSQRRVAKVLHLSRTTVKRKFCFLGQQSQLNFKKSNHHRPLAHTIEFDDLETFEHTKYKPLSITLAVESKTRRILGFRVSPMPAKGRLSARARKKYGIRKDERTKGREALFAELQGLVHPLAVIKSDQNPHYPPTVTKYFPQATYQTFQGQRGSIVGQGELKKVRFDPLFSLNHTCAMLRANVNRLIRKTWCTTKLRECLELHLAMYAVYHNNELLRAT